MVEAVVKMLQPGFNVASIAAKRRNKSTFAEMRAAGVRGLLIYCSDYHCSHGHRSPEIGGR
jgi:hypothetical protein